MFREQSQELDAGGYARLDVSDLLEEEEPADWETLEERPAPNLFCDWCREPRRGGAYLVVADNRHYEVCTTCWGRSPGYVELRQAGVLHETALRRLGAVSKAQEDDDDDDAGNSGG